MWAGCDSECMPRIAVPEGKDPMMYLWTERASALAHPAGAFSSAVYAKSTLPIREFEAARVRTAQINNCQVCLNFRSATDVLERAAEADQIDEEFYAHIGEYDWPGFTERERLSAELAEKFAVDHKNIGEDFWKRLHAEFTDDELVELALCISSWVAFGRMNVIFDVDGACRVPQYA
jgi:alkylhydroperoxidase family enzyme